MSVIDDLIKEAEANPLDEELRKLAELPSYQYQSIREKTAKQLGFKVGALDEAVKEMRAELKTSRTKTESYFDDVVPFDGNVDTCELLNETRNFLNTYLFLPKYADVIITLWITFTHVFKCFKIGSRLIFTSSDPESGKSLALDVLEQLVAKSFLLSSATGASLYRFIEKERPTLLLDEYDTYMKGNEVIRGLINAGHKYNGKSLKCVGDDHDAKVFECYCPVAMAGIGTRVLNATILSRSHVIKMKPAKEFEITREFDLDDKETSESLKLLQSKFARWTLDNQDDLKNAKPKPHVSLRNRKKDNWKAFYAIAELAGEKWIDLANNAVETMWQGRSLTFKEKLLADIRDVFESDDLEQIRSIDLTNKLNKLELRSYVEMNEGRGVSQSSIANMLKGYDIKPKRIDFYIDGERKQLRGYTKDMFADAWDRHLTSGNIIPFPAETSAQSVTTSQVTAGNGFKQSASVTSIISVTPEKVRKANGDNGCDTVALPPSSEGGKQPNGVCNECKNLQKDICTEGSNKYQATKDGECVDFVYKRQETVINN